MPALKFPLLTLLVSLTTLISAQGTGTQFITGPCTSDAICASGCCGFNSGKCAGPIVAQERDGGCGFGDAQPNDRAARLLRGEGAAGTAPSNGFVTVTTTASSAVGGGTGTPVAPPTAAGTQFITGACARDADCASKCCGFRSGKCAGPIVAQERDGGCGFGNATSNDDAARELRGQS